MKINNKPLLFAIAIIIWVFLPWIISPVTIGGDFNFVSYDQFKEYSQSPYLWDYTMNNGFGEMVLFTLPFFWYAWLANTFTTSINNAFLLHKLIYFYPLILLNTIGIWILAKTIIKNRWAQAISSVLYICNTYFIMLVSGGQIGVAFAYAWSPVVITISIKTLQKINLNSRKITIYKWFFLLASSIAIHISFDSRLALITLSGITILYSINLLQANSKLLLLKFYSVLIIIGIIIVGGFHAYWLIPSMLIQNVSLPTGYASTSSVQFFSFSRFAHTLTWTHPNYPDNIFGVVKEVSGFSFIIPILAFWLLRTQRKLVVILSAIAAISAFLAKGTNEPFGGLYLWAFQHVATFSWFRDSTKFFLPLSLAYVILIGLTIQELIQSKINKVIKIVIFTASTMCLVYIWFPTFSNQIGGTLKYRSYPQEFKEIESVLKSDQTFGRVLWIPSREMYGYTDRNHPAISLQLLRNNPTCLHVFCLPANSQSNPDRREFTKTDLFREIDEQMNIFSHPDLKPTFKELAINYIVISPDIDKTIYLYDRKYDQSVKDRYIQNISSASWLEPLYINNVTAFTLTNTTSLISDKYSGQPLTYKYINPTKYTITLPQGTNSISFNQKYNQNWALTQNQTIIIPTESRLGMMEFNTSILKPGEAILEFQGQKYANYGWIISIIVIITSSFITIFLNFKEKN